MMVWYTRSPRVKAFLSKHDPSLAEWLKRCAHGRRVRVPGMGADQSVRDAGIRSELHRFVEIGYTRSHAIEILAEAYRLSFRHIQRIVSNR